MKFLFAFCMFTVALNSYAENPPSFEPSIISNEEASLVFNRMNSNYRPVSEVSDLSYVWAFEEYERTGLKSQNAFIFFTAAYINKVKFKWWYQVAPAFLVKEGNSIELKVFDFLHSDKPLPIKEWTDKFVYSHRPCKVTTRFTDYDFNDQTEECFLIIESMYYRWPSDLQSQEQQNKYLSGFDHVKVKAARRHSFNEEKNSLYKVILRPMNNHLQGYIPHGQMEMNWDGDELIINSWMENLLTVTPKQSIHLGERCPDFLDDLNKDGFIDINESIKASGPELLSFNLKYSSPGSVRENLNISMDKLNESYETCLDNEICDQELFMGNKPNLKGKAVIVTGQYRSNNLLGPLFSSEQTEMTFPVACGLIQE